VFNCSLHTEGPLKIMAIIDILVTCPDRPLAMRIAEALVGERLAACASIGGSVTSLYRWRGAVEQAEEVSLLLKTRAERFSEAAARIRSLHPYETPCIIATPIVAADPDYEAWVEAETR
jgi:periplasmic divalent cation tolerance protein